MEIKLKQKHASKQIQIVEIDAAFKHGTAIVRLPASEVAKSTIQEGPQYSIYQKRDQIWSLKLHNSFQYRKG